ncbi:MAG: hypothetical protein ACKOAY_08020 [Haliscomenobacter sp.]
MPTYQFIVKFWAHGLSGLQSTTVTAQNALGARNQVEALWGEKLKSIHSATRL